MKHVKLFEQFINEADMTKYYDGFIILDTKSDKSYKAKYIKGVKNTTAENDAIERAIDKIGGNRSNFMVNGFINKGEWNSSELEKI